MVPESPLQIVRYVKHHKDSVQFLFFSYVFQLCETYKNFR